MARPRRRTRAFVVVTMALLGVALPLIPAPAGMQPSTAPAYTVRRAKVAQTWCTLAVPAAWQRKLLIYAHDYLPEDAPLGAPLNPDALAYRTLLEDGWMVTATSYRSTGRIPRQEAIEDIDALREFVVREYGSPQVTLLLGASGGGDIVTSIAERKPPAYQGALAAGAIASPADASAGEYGFTFEPSIPLLFLATSTGVDGPRSYVSRAHRAPMVPILWTVSRPGDLNITQQELLAALNGLVTWAGGTRIETSKDVTAVAPRSQSAELTGKVLAVNRRFGNLMTSFTTEDMDRLGIGVGGTFTLVAGGKPFRIRYVTSFGDVSEGEWFAVAIRSGLGESQFEDNLTIGRNRADAAAASGADVGTMLAVRRQVNGA